MILNHLNIFTSAYSTCIGIGMLKIFFGCLMDQSTVKSVTKTTLDNCGVQYLYRHRYAHNIFWLFNGPEYSKKFKIRPHCKQSQDISIASALYLPLDSTLTIIKMRLEAFYSDQC